MHPNQQSEEKKVLVRFLVPAMELEKIKRVIEVLGGIEELPPPSKAGLTSWRELTKDRKGTKPGRILRGFRRREEMSQAELAAQIKTRQSHISAMERGKSPIGEAVAKKLAKVFKTRPEVFM